VNPANALTLLSAASAVAGLLVLVSLRGPLATAVACTCVGASLLLDRLDGAVARRLGLTSKMGAQLDSLADLLAFGALPAALITARSPSLPVAAAALAHALGAVWRLARYDEEELTEGPLGPSFRGVPSPAAGAAVVTAVALGSVAPSLTFAEPMVAFAMAALMPSSVRYPKRGVGAWPWMVIVPLALVAVWGVAWARR
jgi:CDP-diacylglycerol--serine O-phosphatidyltransferase